jgi:hypothetical protein
MVLSKLYTNPSIVHDMVVGEKVEYMYAVLSCSERPITYMYDTTNLSKNKIFYYGMISVVKKYLIDPPSKEGFDNIKSLCEQQGIEIPSFFDDKVADIISKQHWPVDIKSIPEKITSTPSPLATIENTDPAHAWVVPFLIRVLDDVWVGIEAATRSWGAYRLIQDFATILDHSEAVKDYRMDNIDMTPKCIYGEDGYKLLEYEAHKLFFKPPRYVDIPTTVLFSPSGVSFETIEGLLEKFSDVPIKIKIDDHDPYHFCDYILRKLKPLIIKRKERLILEIGSTQSASVLYGKRYFRRYDREVFSKDYVLKGDSLMRLRRQGILSILHEIFGFNQTLRGTAELPDYLGIYLSGFTNTFEMISSLREMAGSSFPLALEGVYFDARNLLREELSPKYHKAQFRVTQYREGGTLINTQVKSTAFYNAFSPKGKVAVMRHGTGHKVIQGHYTLPELKSNLLQSIYTDGMILC